MTLNITIKTKIDGLKREFDELKTNKQSLLTLIDEAEIAEGVYNSNAIENSTLTLKETEKILMELEISRDLSLREVFEAKNLARIIEYLRNKDSIAELNENFMFFLHKMLLENISPNISGRFRQNDEYVRVGMHIGLPPQKILESVKSLLVEYSSNNNMYFLEKISEFHLEFEAIHPFNDGNGRMGRVLLNFQLGCLGFPNIIIKNKEKLNYYLAFNEYNESKKIKTMIEIINKALTESLYKRLAYLKSLKIITLSDYVKQKNDNSSSIFNSAKRQTIPAFREKGVWKIGI